MCSFRQLGAARNYSINYCLRRVINSCNATERGLGEPTELGKTECFSWRRAINCDIKTNIYPNTNVAFFAYRRPRKHNDRVFWSMFNFGLNAPSFPKTLQRFSPRCCIPSRSLSERRQSVTMRITNLLLFSGLAFSSRPGGRRRGCVQSPPASIAQSSQAGIISSLSSNATASASTVSLISVSTSSSGPR